MALLSLGLVLSIPFTAAWQVGPDFSNNFGRPGADATFDCESLQSIPSDQKIIAYWKRCRCRSRTRGHHTVCRLANLCIYRIS
jgi:hypothetical protein